MSLLKGHKQKKKKVRARAKTGIQGVGPSELADFDRMAAYFHNEMDINHYTDIVSKWIKKNLTQEDAKSILVLPNWKYGLYSRFGALCHWKNLGLEMNDVVKHTDAHYNNLIEALKEEGSKIVLEKKEETPKNEVVVISPMKRLANKVNATLLTELDVMIDEWLDGEKTDRSVYELFGKFELPGAAVSQVKNFVQCEYDQYSDAYTGSCEQAVEAYSYLPKKELKRRMEVFESMLKDLDRIKNTTTIKRAAKKRKPRAADKQVKSMKFKTHDKEYKLDSLNPILIVGSIRLYCFNTKTRVFTYYQSDSTEGFSIKGTTIQRFDAQESYTLKLRKPEDILPIVLGRADKTIHKSIDALTTKKSIPNGRINTDTILLRTT